MEVSWLSRSDWRRSRSWRMSRLSIFGSGIDG
jgi:hypothetical protein